jgi:ribonuclease Z
MDIDPVAKGYLVFMEAGTMRILFCGTACAEAAAESGFTSLLVQSDAETILIDCSGNPVQCLLRAGVDPMSLETLVLTHAHTDHIYAYPALLHTLHCLKRSRELRVVCEPDTRLLAEALAAAAGLEAGKLTFPWRYSDHLKTAGLSVRLLPGRHSVPSSMVKITAGETSLLYTSDTASFPGIAAAARGCGALVHEATSSQAALSSDPDLAGHSSALQAGENAAAAGVSTLFLCHLCSRLYAGRDPAEEAARAYAGPIIVPQPFCWYGL